MTASSQVSVGLTASRNSSPHATASVRSACVSASTSASAHAAGKFEAVAQLLRVAHVASRPREATKPRW
eukprot:scaffold23865_cov49-Phaeocystis_antarctica.AAC.2